MGRAGFEPALLYQELGPKPSAYANFATCPWCFLELVNLCFIRRF
jgi:hypothetical protein